MKYAIHIEKAAEKFIMKQPKANRERLIHAISKLPEQGDIKKLRSGKSAGLYRLRVEDYRVIFSVDHGRLIVLVVDAGNRGQIYKRY